VARKAPCFLLVRFLSVQWTCDMYTVTAYHICNEVSWTAAVTTRVLCQQTALSVRGTWCVAVLKPRKPDGPGEMGRPVVIGEDRQVEMKEKFKLNQFNLLATDLISANRSLPDVRMDTYVLLFWRQICLLFFSLSFSSCNDKRLDCSDSVICWHEGSWPVNSLSPTSLKILI